VNKAASTFNMDKLTWLNQQYIKNAEPARLVADLTWQLENLGAQVPPGFDMEGLIVAQQERSTTLREMAMASLYFFQDFEGYEEKAAKKNFKADAVVPLTAVRDRLAELVNWQAVPIHEAVIATAEALDLKLGKVAQPIRVAVSGGAVSPPIDQTLALLGRDKSLERLDKALEYILAHGQ
jgi:glutamyl-tRNA synthetase